MLRSATSLQSHQILAQDGNVGELRDFLFDQDVWQVRYLVVDTGRWLSRHEVLISPEAVHQPEWDARRLPVDLTKEQVRTSPTVSSATQLSPDDELRLRQHYGWSSAIRGSAGAEGLGAGAQVTTGAPSIQALRGGQGESVTPAATPGAGAGAEVVAAGRRDESVLRSFRDLVDYHVQAVDGAIGHVADVLIDDESWEVRFLVVDTRNWLRGRKVVLTLNTLTGISSAESHVVVNLTRERIEQSPPLGRDEAVSNDYLTRLQRHYETGGRA